MTSAITFLSSFSNDTYILDKAKKEDETFLGLLHCDEERTNKIKKLSSMFAEKYARIKELDPSYEIPSDPSDLREERKANLLKAVRDVATGKELDENSVFIHIDDTFYIKAESRQLSGNGGLVSVSPLFLLEASDLIDFQVSGANDPKLFDDQFLERAKNHVAKILDIKKEEQFAIFNKSDFAFFLLLMREPEKWNEAKKFIFSHELEHVHLKHTYQNLANRRPTGTFLATSISAALLGYLDVLQPILPSSVLWTVSAAATAKWVWTKWNHSCERHAQELAADAGAVKKLQSVEGLNYILKNRMEFNKISRTKSKLFSWIYSPHGESLMDKFGNYPSSKERLKNAAQALG